MKKIFVSIFLILGIFIGILFWNYAKFDSLQLEKSEKVNELVLSDSVAHLLAEAIRYKTISYDDTSKIDYAAFLLFHKFLKEKFPITFQKLEVEIVHQYSLLLTLKGKDLSLAPIVLMGHQDVVPFEDVTRYKWLHDPFSGTIENGIIYGRGAIDDKINVIGVLCAIEAMLQKNMQPTRTILLAFGHDEEIGGEQGAKKIAEILAERKIQPAFVLDEGGIITEEKVPGLEHQPVALIGTAEKGYLTLELSVSIPGGHSSMPESVTSIHVLSKAIDKLVNSPFEARFSIPQLLFIRHLGPEMPFVNKLAMANLWLTKPLVLKQFSASAVGNAGVRTTIAPTIFHAGIKENVVPTNATAIINFRLLPNDSPDKVIQYVSEAIHDTLIKIQPIGKMLEASTPSPDSGWAYHVLTTTIKTVFGESLTSPYLCIGGTDAKHFEKICKNVYRFTPMTDPIGFHGLNEQLRVDDFKKAVYFYYNLLKEM